MTIPESPYMPPKATLSDPIVEREAYTNRFSRNMLIATTIMSLPFVIIFVLEYFIDPKAIDVPKEIVSTLFVIAQLILVVYLIRRVRVKNLGTNNEIVPQELGVWGYCWRTVVASLVSMILVLIPAALMATLTGFSLVERVPMLTATVIYGLISFPALIIVTWALFSKDRSSQAKSVAGIFRGY